MYVLGVHVTMRVYAARECTADMYTMLRVCDAREFIYKLVSAYIGWRAWLRIYVLGVHVYRCEYMLRVCVNCG